jgi:hypothetical protein
MADLRVVPDPVFTKDAGKVLGCWLSMLTFGIGFWVAVIVTVTRWLR